jgi:ribosomal protein S18 acetylase RimI-like enzyme
VIDFREKPGSPEDILHYGVKGMKWGVRKDQPSGGAKKQSHRERFHEGSPGAIVTRVIAKTGETITVEKEKPSRLAVAIGVLTGREPPESVSSMVIKDRSGKKVGSFQIWKDDESTVRGEWLSIKKDSQGRGYSRAAIEGLLIAAKKDPTIKSVKAEVPREALAAQHIYSGLGFKKYKTLGDTPQFGIVDDWELRLR